MREKLNEEVREREKLSEEMRVRGEVSKSESERRIELGSWSE